MEILNSLGRFPYPMVADTFEQYLSAPEISGPMRGAAVEALAQSSKEVVPFLLEAAANDMDPAVRARQRGPLASMDPTINSDRD